MRAMLVDDDAHFCEVFLERLQECADKLDIEIFCEACHDPEKVLEQNAVYDIYFLDIKMREMDGLELAARLRARFVNAEIVFLSFYEQYVWHSFRVRPRAFVRKARMDAELPAVLKDVARQRYGRESAISLPGGGPCAERVKPSEILYCMSEEHYVKFVRKDGESRLCRMKLDQAEALFAGCRFVRIHSRYLINAEHITGMFPDRIALADGQELPVSRPYKKKVQMTVMNLLEQRRGECGE